MANKKETTPAKQESKSTELTSENIMDAVKAKNLQNESTVKSALEEIEKETDEKKKRDAKHAILKHQYKNARALIELRQRRAEEKATKDYLTATKTTLDDYLAGKLTQTEAEKKDETDEKNKRDAFNKISQEFDANIRELRNAYPGYWSYDWECRWLYESTKVELIHHIRILNQCVIKEKSKSLFIGYSANDSYAIGNKTGIC